MKPRLVVCTLCADDNHFWSEPADELFEDGNLCLRRQYCACPVCSCCPAVTVAVADTSRWYGQHRLA